MSNNVVSLSSFKEEKSPHLAGKCRCTACKHEWEGAAPIGTVDLECPSCGLMKGAFKMRVYPAVGSLIYVCNTCDGELFSFDLSGHALCAGCGTSHFPWSDA